MSRSRAPSAGMFLPLISLPLARCCLQITLQSGNAASGSVLLFQLELRRLFVHCGLCEDELEAWGTGSFTETSCSSCFDVCFCLGRAFRTHLHHVLSLVASHVRTPDASKEKAVQMAGGQQGSSRFDDGNPAPGQIPTEKVNHGKNLTLNASNTSAWPRRGGRSPAQQGSHQAES